MIARAGAAGRDGDGVNVRTVFLDANALKFGSPNTIFRGRPPISVPFGDSIIEGVVIYDFVDRLWTDTLKGERARSEGGLLPKVCELAKRGVLDFRTSDEVRMEWAGLLGSFGRKKIMHGAPVETAKPPMVYGRNVSGGPLSWREYRNQFILSVSEPRFLEIASACGARDSTKPRPNALWDAFHVWTAEVAGVEFFLTLDLKLRNRVQNRGTKRLKVKVVSPSDLLTAVATDP